MSGTHAAVNPRSPTRQSLRRSGYGSPAKADSRYGDGAPAGPKDLLPSIREKIVHFAQGDNRN